MGFVIERKEGAPKAALPDNFTPIKPGKYEAYLYNVEFKEFGGKGKNAGRPAYNISFKIAPGQDFANRVLFLSPMLLLAERWAPSPKHPEGYPNGTLWEFLSAVNKDGKTPKELVDEFNETGDITVPDPRDLVGELVEIMVGIENDSYAWAQAGSPEGKEKEFQRNTIRKISPASEGTEEEVETVKVDETKKRVLTL